MGRSLDVDQLVGAAEIARRLGLPRAQQVHQLRQRDPTFPAPVVRLDVGEHGTYLWYWPEVERWARRNG